MLDFAHVDPLDV